MEIEVRCYGTLCDYINIKSGIPFVVKINKNKNTNIKELIEFIGLPTQDVKFIIVNGRNVDGNYILQEGDRISIFPPVAGG
ncbi:MoaD/ThiS family protein [Natranaerofaba carboxydovora]|uniref:MoaD/ThiS family protein n=1 Tax=Natranaerofaba carboxydovora TaxID=2742683 RepID=UPI001F1440B3|nr:MoaD/ThiS family protein [Natranaerofaba carboxydovora]UMZ74233.1 ThiS family protein [Natranaerofaba carboxydovora]